MDSCPTKRAVVAYVEGRLDASSGDLLEKHARGCRECSQRISMLSGVGVNSSTMPESASGLPSSRKQVGRYVLLRMLGHGGMGAVYEAHDTELDRKVALKLLRERWSDEPTWAKLRREAQAMAKLAHPSVVVVHDVGVADEQPYLTMELVDGTTLTKWLAERKRSFREILDAFRQAGRGLAAAHAVGIVHRDFKPDNVLVARSGRVCVTDFGLAVTARDPDDAVTGTPAFMAPEQMSLKPVDARADVFAFCVSLFTALYGTRPFNGGTLKELRDAIVDGRVNPPAKAANKAHKTGVPSWVRDVLLVGMRADPDERYATMDALLAALDPAPRARRRRVALGAAAAVAVAFGLAFAWNAEAKRLTARALLAPVGATRVAVAVVDHDPSGRDGAEEAIGPIVAAALAPVDRVVVVDPDFVSRVAAAQRARGGMDPAALAAAVGASRVVLVELDAGTARATVDDAVPRVAPLVGASERIAGGAWLRASRALAVDVAEAFGAPSSPARAAAEAASPGDAGAAVSMGRAIRAERAHHAATAAALYDDACRADPSSAAACARRAQVLHALGDESAAAAAVKIALDRAASAPPEARAEIEALSLTIAGEHGAAIARYRDLWSAHRDDRARALSLAAEQQRAGLRNDAVATLDAVRARGVAVGADPDVDLFEADLRYLALKDPKGALAAARAVVVRAEAIGDTWLGARARYKEALAIADVSGNADGEALLGSTKQLFVAEHDDDGEAMTDMNIAALRTKAGDLEPARATLLDVVNRAQKLDDLNLERLALGDLAIVYTYADDLVAAIDVVTRLVAIWRDARNDPQLATQLNNLCVLTTSHGDVRGARPMCEEALSIRRRLGDRLGIRSSLVNVALAEGMAGDRAAEEAHLREALGVALDLGAEVTGTRCYLVGSLLSQRKYAEAQRLARTAIAESVAASDTDDEGTARAQLARILAESGGADEARKAIDDAERAEPGATSHDSRLAEDLDIAAARLAVARTPAERVAVALKASKLSEDATHGQWLGIALEARLLHARAVGSQAELAAVEADARAIGQEWLADQAQEASARVAVR
jgi:hypothetical protein